MPTPTDVDESLPTSVDDLISTAIARERDERFEHSLLFREELEVRLSDDFPSLLDN